MFYAIQDFFDRLKWWLFKKNKICKSCCLFCKRKHYKTCVVDTMSNKIEIILQAINDALALDYLTAKERKASIALAIAKGIQEAKEGE